ncbi:MAG: hypothetical protein A2Z09_06435 [Nitrospirae bacterium RBG_16_43_8]|nr:MAG: hypothetical protein A2Z09_06435 [Nitrospirae bacterium RBG_16_43_8]
MITLRGKSLTAVARDIAEGYVTVNPIFLKPLDAESLEGLYRQIVKVQTEIRGEKFPHGNINLIRGRNIRLQRLHSSLMIIRNFAKERGMKHLF